MTAYSQTDRICELLTDDSGVASPEIEQERRVAIYDLLEDNRFQLPARDEQQAPHGPYRLRLAKQERRLVFDVSSEAGAQIASFHLSLTPLKRVISDYLAVCDSYYDAVKRLSPSQIEAIDMGRRGAHDDASETLRERLDGKVAMDKDTSRRLFTLICALVRQDMDKD